MLIQSESTLEFVSISWQVILIVVAFTLAFFLFAIGMGIKAQQLKPTTGVQGIIGEVGVALTNLSPNGQVNVHGEIWSAECLEGFVDKGMKVRIEAIENLNIKVRKA